MSNETEEGSLRAKSDATKIGPGVKLLLVLMILGAGVMLFFAARFVVRTKPGVARKFDAPIPVEAVKVKVANLDQLVGASGQVLQYNTDTISSRIASTALEVPVNIGDAIHVGTVLFQADRRAFDAALDAAQAQVTLGATTIDKDTRELEALEAMRHKDLASDIEVDTARVALEQARTIYAQAKLAVVNAQLDIEASTLKSPVNGVVLARFVNPFERVQTNQVLFQLGNLDKVYFLAATQEDMVGAVFAGQRAGIVFSSFPSAAFSGIVEQVDPRTDPKTRTFTTYIAIENPRLQLKPGITGFARLQIRKTALAVPTAAIMNPLGENASVFVIDSGSNAILTPVRVGVRSEGMTQITEGLKEGDIVVTAGTLYLKDHDNVRANVSLK